LRDINLEIKHGEFCCVIGDVGSGKSSLLNAIIGDMLYLDNAFVNENKDLNINDKFIAQSVKSYS
jgi:ABC-type lipoprotein export system ATPase subunit